MNKTCTSPTSIKPNHVLQMAAVQEFAKASNARIELSKSEIAKLSAMLPYSEMTMEEFAEAHPELSINVNAPTAWPHNPEDQKVPDNAGEHH